MRLERNAPKMGNQQLVSTSRQCSSAPVGFFRDFLTKNNVTTLEHPPYSPDLAPADFYPFPRLKSALKGRSICDVTDKFRNATEELKLPLEMFLIPSQSLPEVYSYTRKLFEEKLYDCTVLYFSEIT